MSYPAHKIANDDANDKEPHALPHNLEVEQGLLGQLLVNNASIDRVADILEPFHFYHPVHSRIYDAILKTVERGDIASPLRLKKYFENESALEAVGGTAYLVDLATASFPFASSEDYARQIFELFQARALIAQCEETRYKAYNQTIDSTVQDLIEEHETHLYTLAESGVAKKDAVSFKDSITEAIRMAEVAYNRGGAVSGVTTGLTELDRMTGGMHPTDLLILAGRPSMGKTALATNIAFNAAKKHLETGGREGAAVGLFSLEMGHAQITTRILGDLCGVSSDAMRKGSISHEDFRSLVEAGQNYKELPFYTDDTAALSISALRTRARRLKRKYGITLLVVDYLQLLNGTPGRKSSENRTQEVSEITRGLKSIAKDLNIPVLALSQLSRNLENREDKRPQLADLRESGSIEQDADVVMFVYRDEYYLSREEPSQKASEETHKFEERHAQWQQALNASKNVTDVLISKQRHGPIGNVKLYFDPNFTRFRDLSNMTPDR